MPLDTGNVRRLHLVADADTDDTPVAVHHPSVEEGADIGMALKAAREFRGLNTQDVADATRIRQSYIEALEDLRDRLKAWEGGADAEALQGEVFAVGRERFEPMRDWFKALYEVLLGASQGPRFGGFIALYGVDETVALIDRALAGTLA